MIHKTMINNHLAIFEQPAVKQHCFQLPVDTHPQNGSTDYNQTHVLFCTRVRNVHASDAESTVCKKLGRNDMSAYQIEDS